jgi:hypothetical protein
MVIEREGDNVTLKGTARRNFLYCPFFYPEIDINEENVAATCCFHFVTCLRILHLHG